MFENLRRAFREAVDNFNKELNRDDVPDVVDRLLHQMQEEVTDAKAQLHTLEEQIKRALQLAELEGKEAATCRRRESMAEKIGDADTAAVAKEYAEKHERRKEIQENKALALREELEWKRKEVEGMLEKIKEARSKREALAATTGRASARNSLGEAEELFSELDRMAEKIESSDHRRQAEEDLISEFDFDSEVPPPPRLDPELEAEAKLRELKRRMGKE